MILRRLGEYVCRGRPQAMAITSLLTVCAMIVPLMTYLFSGIVPALVTLRQGPVPGLQVIAGSTLLVAAVALVSGINPYLMLVFTVGIWLPLWFCAVVLRLTEDQGRMLLAAGLCGLLYIALSHWVLGDVAQWWKSVLEVWVEQILSPGSAGKYGGQLVAMAPWMNAVTNAGLLISLVTTVFCARWWQAHLFHAGGFRLEFLALHLPRGLTLALLACVAPLAAGQAEPGSIPLEALVLVVFLYLFQGMAAAHRLVATGKLARTWLYSMYILLAIVPQAVLFVACLGMVDSWMFRTATPRAHDKS